jgi:hypothetical protein
VLAAAADLRVTVRSLGTAAMAALGALGLRRTAGVGAGGTGSVTSENTKGRRGKRGRRGPVGPPGPTTTEIVADERDLGAAAGSKQTCVAGCPDDQVLVGGGFDTGADDGSVAVTSVFPEPAPNPTEYGVSFVRLVAAGNPTEGIAFAICAPAED